MSYSPHEPHTSYPEPRVYMVRGEDKVDDLIDLIELTSANFQPDGKWAIIKVDGSDLEVHVDPECGDDPDFVYTTQAVRAEACSLYDTFEF